MMKKTKAVSAGLAMLALAGTAFVSSPAKAADDVKLTYWLWDSNQLPMYQACADAFTKANPTIKVELQQKGAV